MPLETWLAFLGASALLLVLPGPTILTVISYSITHGRRAACRWCCCCAPAWRRPRSQAGEAGSRWKLFANTYLVTALNPKGIIFFVAFLPQFIDPAGDTVRQMWILSATFVTCAGLNAAAYALFAGQARRLLASRAARLQPGRRRRCCRPPASGRCWRGGPEGRTRQGKAADTASGSMP